MLYYSIFQQLFKWIKQNLKIKSFLSEPAETPSERKSGSR